MNENLFWDDFPSAVTICDTKGIIVYMNKKSASTFEKWGGNDLIGKSLFDCHAEKSCKIIHEILSTGVANTYTIEKDGKKKLIHQSPWHQDGTIGGLTEISIELPENMNHFIR